MNRATNTVRFSGGSNFTIQQDWIDFLHLQLTMGVQQLDAAAASVSPKQSPVVVITIPYPDPRATDWGTVDGKSLDLSKLNDQVAAVSWYVDHTIKQVASLNLQQAKFGKALLFFHPSAFLSVSTYRGYCHAANLVA